MCVCSTLTGGPRVIIRIKRPQLCGERDGRHGRPAGGSDRGQKRIPMTSLVYVNGEAGKRETESN